MLILGLVQHFARNASNFDDLPKTGNYITPEEIGEMRELQQVTTTVPDAAKDADFIALNF